MCATMDLQGQGSRQRRLEVAAGGKPLFPFWLGLLHFPSQCCVISILFAAVLPSLICPPGSACLAAVASMLDGMSWALMWAREFCSQERPRPLTLLSALRAC